MIKFRVEIRGQREMADFSTLAEAKDYAVTMTVWNGGAYRIHRIKVARTVVAS